MVSMGKVSRSRSNSNKDSPQRAGCGTDTLQQSAECPKLSRDEDTARRAHFGDLSSLGAHLATYLKTSYFRAVTVRGYKRGLVRKRLTGIGRLWKCL